MSWRSKDDLGQTMVANIHDVLRIPDEWLIDRGPRGFTWWAGQYAQSVWSDAGNFHNGVTLYRLHCDLELLRCEGHGQEIEQKLVRFLKDTTLSALVYDRALDMYRLHCSVYAQEENREWLRRVFMAAVALQVADAQFDEALVADCGLKPAKSPHPTHGLRMDVDPLVHSVTSFFLPVGKQASRWQEPEEWNDARARVGRIAQHAVTDARTYLEAEFDWPGTLVPARLEIRTDEPHSKLEQGLKMTLTLPVELPLVERVHAALDLNERERKEWNWCHDLGCWICEGGRLAFQCFVPNICYSPGMLSELAHDMAIRATWVSEELERRPF
jgi:hypothetical protein